MSLCVGAGRSSLYLSEFKSTIPVYYLSRDKGILWQMMAILATYMDELNYNITTLALVL